MSIEKKLCLAALPFTQRGMPIVMDVSPDQKTLLYQHANTVYLRGVEDPSQCDTYTQHAQQVTVAKYAPSGFYIASGDASGKIRIWDTVNLEHILKYEYPVLGGKVKDIAWTEDSKRLLVVGEGNEKFGAAIMWDTGTSVGELRGPTKPVNSVAVRPCRPYRAVVASEDFSVTFYEGPPFKFKSSFREHTNFVNVVRYSPNGEVFVTGGADGRMFIFEGKTGEKTGELCEAGKAHKGGIYAVAFSPDSKLLLSASGDKSCKVWDHAAPEKELCHFNMGSAVTDMQVGCAWAGERLLSVSLSGHINYLDMNNPAQPQRIVKGHNKNITSLTLAEGAKKAITGSFDGLICVWDLETGSNELIDGNGHKNQIQDMHMQDGNLITISLDDTIMSTKLSDMKYGSERAGLESQPRGLAVGKNGLQIVACLKEVVIFRNLKKVYTEPLPYEAECVAIHPSETQVAVGGKEDGRLHIYDLSGDTLTEAQSFGFGNEVTSVQYSADGAHMVVTDANKRLTLFSYPDYKELAKEMWVRHTAKIMCADFSPDGSRIVSGGVDTNIFVYTVGTNKFLDCRAAHPQSAVTKCRWIDDNTIASVGHDCCLRLWNVIY